MPITLDFSMYVLGFLESVLNQQQRKNCKENPILAVNTCGLESIFLNVQL